MKPPPAAPTVQQASALSLRLLFVKNPFCEQWATEAQVLYSRMFDLTWCISRRNAPAVGPSFGEMWGRPGLIMICAFTVRARLGDYSRSYGREKHIITQELPNVHMNNLHGNRPDHETCWTVHKSNKIKTFSTIILHMWTLLICVGCYTYEYSYWWNITEQLSQVLHLNIFV